MKNLLLLLSILVISIQTNAQFDCTDGRFDVIDYFSEIEVTEDIYFGENDNPTLLMPNATETLEFDIYQPVGDQAEYRPMVIMAFGGSFIAGNRKSPDIVEFCTRLAHTGYVAVSIDYRLTTDLIFASSETMANRAVMKSIHDMKAAVRFFRNDIDVNNTYKIHPNHIYVGGVSAGGFAALHTAFLDKDSEIPDNILDETMDNGGLEGLSGTPDVSSEVNGVINLCGAIADTTWIEAGHVPVVSVHGDQDQTVPYGSGSITLLNLNYAVHGSASINDRANDVGMTSDLYTLWGTDHVPFVGSELYMDTTFNFVKDFMLPIVCAPVAVEDLPTTAFNATVFPNPAYENINITIDHLLPDMNYQLMDVSGKVIDRQNINETNFAIIRDDLMPGMYFLRINSSEGYLVKKLVFSF